MSRTPGRSTPTSAHSSWWLPGTTGFQSAVFPLAIDGLTMPGYAALYALVLNVGLCIVISPIFNQARATQGSDETAPSDYRFGLRSR